MKTVKTFFVLILGLLLISATVEEGKCKGEKDLKKSAAPKGKKKTATLQPLFEILLRV